MSKLKFHKEPQQKLAEVGDEHCGILQIPRYHCLLQGEMAFFEQVAAEQNEATLRLYDLAHEIAQKTQQETVEVFGWLLNPQGHGEALAPYAERISDLPPSPTPRQVKNAIATMLLTSRVDSNWTAEDTEKEINLRLLDHLVAFVGAERDNLPWPPQPQPAGEGEVPGESTGLPSETGSPQTGTPSTE